MLSRDDLYYRLLYLVPDAKFSFWPYEPQKNDKPTADLVVIDGWQIDWNADNAQRCPSSDDVKKVDPTALKQRMDSDAKKARNVMKVEDLGIVAGFATQQKANPALTFSDYVDQLEGLQATIKAQL